MSLNDKIQKLIQHSKSIRFRLTLIYSIVVFSFVGLILFGLNIYVHQTLHRDVPDILERVYIAKRGLKRVPIIGKEERERLEDIREDDLERIQQITLFSLVPIGIFSFVIGYQVSGMFLSPLDKLRIRIDDIKAHHLGDKIPVTNDDEIGRLIDSFNDMSLRLEKAFTQQTRFVQDASHELRTPLTVIQTNLESSLDDELATKEDINSSIKTALVGIKQLTKLTEELLELTSPNGIQKTRVDLVELIKNQTISLQKYAKQEGVSLNSESEEKKLVQTIKEARFKRAIMNLIENAIKYSKSVKDPKVTVKLRSTPKNIVIEVIDNGPGIPKEHQEKIFKRFYRIDKSRNKQSGGFGLGLAITKKIIEDHGGKITVVRKDEQTVFGIHLKNTQA